MPMVIEVPFEKAVSVQEARSAMVKQIVVSTVILGVMMAVFFASAGRRDIPRAWLFFGATFLYFVGSTLTIHRFNPGLIVARMTMRREGSKTWDERARNSLTPHCLSNRTPQTA